MQNLERGMRATLRQLPCAFNDAIGSAWYIDLALIYAALAYYHLHRAEIDADIQANSEQAVQQEFEQA